MHMKPLFILFFLISAAITGQDKLDKLLRKWNHRNVPYISAETLALPKTMAILLDAREKEEFNVSHLKNAIYVGYNHFNLKETIIQLPRDKSAKIVVYCSLGIRSETVAHNLIQEGYKNVFNLYGGIFEWKNNDFKVMDTLGNETEKIHIFRKNWSTWLNKGEKIYE
jgi:rhodanese-related sulfurtransferase